LVSEVSMHRDDLETNTNTLQKYFSPFTAQQNLTIKEATKFLVGLTKT
jgi:hypothetical protein